MSAVNIFLRAICTLLVAFSIFGMFLVMSVLVEFVRVDPIFLLLLIPVILICSGAIHVVGKIVPR